MNYLSYYDTYNNLIMSYSKYSLMTNDIADTVWNNYTDYQLSATTIFPTQSNYSNLCNYTYKEPKKEMKETICILSIDPALSTTGYAIFTTGIKNVYSDEDKAEKRIQAFPYSVTEDEIPNSFLLNFGKITTSKKDGDDIIRIRKILSELIEKCSGYNIEYVIMEDGYMGNNSKTAIQLATLRGAILGYFAGFGNHIEMLQPSSIRKFFKVGGNAKKEEVAHKVQSMFPLASTIIGLYSDKQNKNKTSDIYDAISIGAAWLMSKSKTAAQEQKRNEDDET